MGFVMACPPFGLSTFTFHYTYYKSTLNSILIISLWLGRAVSNALSSKFTSNHCAHFASLAGRTESAHVWHSHRRLWPLTAFQRPHQADTGLGKYSTTFKGTAGTPLVASDGSQGASEFLQYADRAEISTVSMFKHVNHVQHTWNIA